MKKKLTWIIKLSVEYGIYLLVFILPWQTRWIIKAGAINGGYWEYGTFSLYGTDVLLILLLLCFLYLKFQIPNSKFKIQNSKINYYWWLIAGLDLFIFISIFFAPNKMLALAGYARFLSGVGLFWLIMEANFDKVKLIYSFLAGIFLQAVLGIWQFLAQTSFANKWLGLALHNPAELGTSVVETLDGGRWLRAYGGLDHPNMLGGLLAVGILFLIYLITRQNLPRRRENSAGTEINNFQFSIFNFQTIFNFQFSIIKFITSYCLLLTFITALFFTFSRGAWAGLITGLFVLLVIAVVQKDRIMQKGLLKIILVSGILVFILFNLYSDLALTRLSQDTRLEVKSNTERVESYTVARKIIHEHWLFGSGIGNYTLAVHDGINNNLPSYAYQPAHNVFLLVWAEIGTFGVLFFLAILASLIIFNFPQSWDKQFSPVVGQAIFPPKADPPRADKQFSIFNFQNKNKNSIPETQKNNMEFQNMGSEFFAAPLQKIGEQNYNFGLPLLMVITTMMLVDHWWWSLHFGVLLTWFLLGLIVRLTKNEE